MTTYPHGLTECEKCGSHYCMGCVGEDCPNCKLQEVAFYGIELENKLEAKRDYLVDQINLYDEWAQIRHTPIGRIRASSMRKALSLMADKFGVAYEKEWRVTKKTEKEAED